ncbi:hypothetical protein B0H13DRAFT_2334058 [Mycena leptocephala]|nr:hypothetical protein B0H13DRAFT_2334058 [Mycena leptocephala]
MAPSATFCKIPLSTSVDPVSSKSLVSLDWILASGIPAPVASGVLALPSGNTVCSMHMKLSLLPNSHMTSFWVVIGYSLVRLRNVTVSAMSLWFAAVPLRPVLDHLLHL